MNCDQSQSPKSDPSLNPEHIIQQHDDDDDNNDDNTKHHESDKDESLVHEIKSDTEDDIESTVGNDESDDIQSVDDDDDDDDDDSSQDRGSDNEPNHIGETVSLDSDSEPETIDDDSDEDNREERNGTHPVTEDYQNEDNKNCTENGDSESKEENAIVADDIKNLPDLNLKIHPVVNSTKIGKSLLSKNDDALSDAGVQNLFRSIAARGTIVTPVSSDGDHKSKSTPRILPTLTDDMFVVEAPSFIVPYVYEKPPLEPLKKFVDTLGKELEEQRKKEELERIREKKETDEAKPPSDLNVEKMETDDRTPDVPEKKKRPKNRRNRDDDDASWDGESGSDSDLSDVERSKTVIIKDKEDDSIDNIKDSISATDLTMNKTSVKSSDYFENPLGLFFMNIGVNLVQEYVQTDLLKQQKRKLYRESRAGGTIKPTEMNIISLLKNLEHSKEVNMPYKFRQKQCVFCNFRTESALAMSHHMETPHVQNNMYKCNFCPFEVRSPHDILFHMKDTHDIRGRFERPLANHQCANCTFEDNGKQKLTRHLFACAKKFKPEHNLDPPVEWEPPAKILKIAKPQHNAYSKSPAMGIGQRSVSSILQQMTLTPVYRNPTQTLGMAVGKPAYRTNQFNIPMLTAGQTSIRPLIPKALQHRPSISITPLPPAPSSGVARSGTANSGIEDTFVICEICDGFIKDSNQYRNHLLWIHKVKIHPKMIYNRPPLNCQKCQFRFFTDQGLERHLLGSHGLITSSMQEAATKGTDSGRCPVCGKVLERKLLLHVSREHNMTLKPANLSYKCTLCTATFGRYQLFENHVYSAHSVVTKKTNRGRPSTISGPSSASKNVIKINDEITVIPQPAKLNR